MFKTFIFGTVLGIAAVIAALHYVPAVDQHRESSIIAVTPNGGNTESFHVKIPTDRIMIGKSAEVDPLPPGMEWPDDELFANVHSELFKLRNSRDAVIGVASRMAASDPEAGDIIEWVLHLPARGSLFIKMPASAGGSGRVGDLIAGSREFGKLLGRVSERWVADDSVEGAGPTGRIELSMTFVSENLELPAEEAGE